MSDYREAMDEWMEKFRYGDLEPAELGDELEKAKVQVNGKWVIKHRYLDEDEYLPRRNQWYNDRFEANRAQAEMLKASEQWWDYVTAHPKSFWPVILEEIKGVAQAADWCNAVRSAWYLSDKPWINQDAWLHIFSDRTRVPGVSTKDELNFFNGLEDPLTIYRGCLPEHAGGLSWSLEETVAEYFKFEAGSRGVIYSGKVEKKHVLAYLNPNNEEYEIIVNPIHVTEMMIR